MAVSTAALTQLSIQAVAVAVQVKAANHLVLV
jgi:hypothetical protein